jgi:hypothetical protein
MGKNVKSGGIEKTSDFRIRKYVLLFNNLKDMFISLRMLPNRFLVGQRQI